MTNPVLIAGAGATGLPAALELSRMGVAERLIDKRDAPATTSRAIGVQPRTLELFERRGLADEMVRLGNSGRFGSILRWRQTYVPPPTWDMSSVVTHSCQRVGTREMVNAVLRAL